MRSLYVKKEIGNSVQVLGFRGKIDLYGYCRDFGEKVTARMTVLELCATLDARQKGKHIRISTVEARKLIRNGAINRTWLD